MTERAINRSRVDAHRYGGTLREYLSKVFLSMCVALLLTGFVAWFIAGNESSMQALFHLKTYIENGETKYSMSPSVWWVAAAIAQLLLVIGLSWMGIASRISATSATVFFAVFAGLNGVTLAPVIYAYTGQSVVKIFFITASMFGGCAIWGHTTKKDMTQFGSFFLMALFGLLAAMIINIVFQAPQLEVTVSIFAVLLFSALIAYDMQMLEEIYNEEGGTYTAGTVVFGALSLYLDFINLFLHLLRLFGVKKPGD